MELAIASNPKLDRAADGFHESSSSVDRNALIALKQAANPTLWSTQSTS
jgi:hypothetical protein